MKHFIFLIFIFLTQQSYGQTSNKIKPFNKSDYPTSKFIIKSDTNFLGKVQIVINQVKTKNNSMTPFYCRSWMSIKKENKVVKHFYYDIEPVGGCSGLFIPKEQPIKDLFIASKFGDYEGEIIIIDTFGKVTTELGGHFFISKDKRYLFSPYDSDLSGLTVYDLQQMKTLYTKEFEEGYFGDWYFQEGKFLSRILIDDEVTGKNKVAIFNLDTKKISLSEKPENYLKAINKLKVYNSIENGNCNCGQ